MIQLQICVENDVLVKPEHHVFHDVNKKVSTTVDRKIKSAVSDIDDFRVHIALNAHLQIRKL